MPKNVQPTSAIQLLVEGKDQGNFFDELVKHLKIEDLQIQDFGGVNELKGFLGVMVKQSGFHDTVRMLGIVRDAETSAQGAFQSVQSSLRNARLPVPVRPGESARPGEPIGAAPAVNVLILPGDGDHGMLETLLCRTFADTAVDRCIDDFFRCFEGSEAGAHIPNPDKARAQVFLATRKRPHVSVGVAARKRYWGNFDHDAFRGIRRFLSSLQEECRRTADTDFHRNPPDRGDNPSP